MATEPVVVHAIRGYLSPTETFVGNQVTRLKRYAAAVVTHHRSPNRQFDIDQMYVIDEQTSGAAAVAERIAYRFLRALPSGEALKAARWARQFDPVLLHCHYAVDAAFFLPLARLLGLPTVVSLYGYDISSFPNALGGLGRVYIRNVFRELDLFLAMSDDMKRDAVALGAPEEKVLVHYHGINAERFRYDGRSYAQHDPFTILCVGSLEPKKGQHYLLRAIATLRREHPALHLRVVLVGDGPLKSELQQLIHDERLEDCIEMAGYVPHLDPRFLEFYRSADVFVHFSTTQPDNDKEGIPGTIVEAMASGLPVIATRHAGIPEVITDEVHGLLLEESDTGGIASALLMLYQSEELRQRMGSNAAHRALRELDLTTKTSLLEDVYDRARALRSRSQSPTHVFA